jgi:signal transduction histidine kinase
VRGRHFPSLLGLGEVEAPAEHPHRGRLVTEIVLALAAGVAGFVITALAATAARNHVPEALFAAALLVVVAALARGAGIVFALPVGVAAALAFDWYFLPPLRALDASTVLVLGTFLIVSVVVAVATTRATRLAISSEDARDVLAAEQGALRRVATLVARQAPPAEVFQSVAAEAGRLLDVDVAQLFAYDDDETALLVGTWSRDGLRQEPPGSHVDLAADGVVGRVFRTRRPARIDDYSEAAGPATDHDRSLGICAAVAAPVLVEGRMWGVMTAGSLRPEPLSAGTEARIAAFAELVATAIGNTKARQEVQGYAEEQAALRRVATLVARATRPEDVFAAVTEEAGKALRADFGLMSRYDTDGAATVVGASNISGGDVLPAPVGSRLSLGGQDLHTLVHRTGRPARIDDYSVASSMAEDMARAMGVRSAVAVPISVEGRLWGNVGVGSMSEQPLPADTEARLVGFTELVATAIANAQARTEVRAFADEQAALRRVATLVARGARPEQVFAAVTEEVGRVLDVDFSVMGRYDPDGAATILGIWTRTGAPVPVPVDRVELGGGNVTTRVFETGRPARLDSYAGASGAAADVGHGWGLRSLVGVPIGVEDRLWGFIIAATSHEEPLPADTETRLVGFTELVGTAIANAEARAALTASRARIVAAADATRRRIERDLHDAAQQRLVSLALRLRSTVPVASGPEADELTAQLDGLAAELVSVVDELRELARGLHPAALADGGLQMALTTLARRSAVPVRLDVDVEGRLPEPVELAAYYVVAEALTNTVKHADATVIDVEAAADEGFLRVLVRDDGRGGADPASGSGLIGLTDRVEALGGRLTLDSRPGAGTAMQALLPLTAPGRAGSSA